MDYLKLLTVFQGGIEVAKGDGEFPTYFAGLSDG
jgi:hypothetical protein